MPPTGEADSFSLPWFVLTVLVTLAVFLAALGLGFPSLWAGQFLPSAGRFAGAFALISLVNCFVEYVFHRYVLHRPVIPFLRRLYRQHTRHHALTRIGLRPGRDGTGLLCIENKFPMVEPEQEEASFFPWYSLAIFAALLTPLLAGLQWLWPAFPWFLSGYAAIACSLVLYESFHAINHWPFERWEPLVRHRVWGRFWRPLYAFHLRHHAVIDCNESVSGFFGLPLADWIFGTAVIPRTLYAAGEEWTPEKFRRPRPRAVIRWLDAMAARAVQAQPRALAGDARVARPEAAARPARTYTRGEEIANWVTHGVGLLLSVLGLTLLIVAASRHGDAWHVVSFTVFGLSLLCLYTASTFYHAWRTEQGKGLFHKLDHAAIFVLIAGTYTPFLLVSLRGPWGWSLFGVIWGLCGAGAVFQILSGERFRPVSAVAYLFLGWLMLVALRPLLAAVPAGGLWLLLAGGLCYSVGVLFYRWHSLRYHHACWHVFVLGGSTCHFLAVLLFLLPTGR